MSKHPPFMCGDKSRDKRVLASWKQFTMRDNIRPQLNKLNSRVIPPSTRGKSFPARSNDSRGKIVRNKTNKNSSSTESTNLSDKEKVNNVLSLREEINEWRRQKTVRRKVNNIFEKMNPEIEGESSFFKLI